MKEFGMSTIECDDRAAAAAESGFFPIEHMTIRRMEHVGIVVEDLAAAIEFFVELGLVLQRREGSVRAGGADRLTGLLRTTSPR
jgi:hypothetical protein